MVVKPAPVILGLLRNPLLLNNISEPIVEQQWYLGMYLSNNYLKPLLKDMDVQHWFEIILVKDCPKMQE
jgi:hypothetical protein